jgi:hypothetical protein
MIKRTPHREPPVVAAVVLCDSIHTDSTSGKHSLLGCFSLIRFPSFPASAPPFHLYVVVTGARCTEEQPMEVRVRITDADQKSVLFDLAGRIGPCDPLSHYELVCEVEGVEFTAPGPYVVQILADGTAVAERRLPVVEAPGAAVRTKAGQA